MDIDHLGLNYKHRPGRPAQVHRVDDQQSVGRGQHLLDQVNAADARFHHPDLRREGAVQECLGHLHAEPVVSPEKVPHTRDENLHDASSI